MVKCTRRKIAAGPLWMWLLRVLPGAESHTPCPSAGPPRGAVTHTLLLRDPQTPDHNVLGARPRAVCARMSFLPRLSDSPVCMHTVCCHPLVRGGRRGASAFRPVKIPAVSTGCRISLHPALILLGLGPEAATPSPTPPSGRGASPHTLPDSVFPMQYFNSSPPDGREGPVAAA